MLSDSRVARSHTLKSEDVVCVCGNAVPIHWYSSSVKALAKQILKPIDNLLKFSKTLSVMKIDLLWNAAGTFQNPRPAWPCCMQHVPV